MVAAVRRHAPVAWASLLEDAWVGAEDLRIRVPAGCTNLRAIKAWVTSQNCVELARQASAVMFGGSPDVLSVDLDGNDLHVAAGSCHRG